MTLDTIPKVHDKGNIVNNVTFIGNIAKDGNGGGLYLDSVSEKI